MKSNLYSAASNKPESQNHLHMDDLEKLREVLMSQPMKGTGPQIFMTQPWQEKLLTAIESENQEEYRRLAKAINRTIYLQGGPEFFLAPELDVKTKPF